MAERRMFSKAITESDAFLDMPLTTQALYFHLSMVADDDGFIGNPKKILRMIGSSEDDLKILIMKRFVLIFENGIIAIKHWKMNNYIRKDRYTETVYLEEKSSLSVKENGSYTEKKECVTIGQPLVNQMETQCSVGKYSIDNTTLNNITLDYYNYIIGEKNEFEDFEENDDLDSNTEKTIVINELKRLDIYVNAEIDKVLTEKKRNEFIIFYWVIKELLRSSHKVYIQNLTNKLLYEKYLRTENYKSKNDIKEFLNYYIKTLKIELEKISRESG